jgi:hypothetical protein
MNSNQIRRDNKGDAIEASLGIGGRIVPVEFMSLKRLKTGHVPFSWYIAHRKNSLSGLEKTHAVTSYRTALPTADRNPLGLHAD